MADYLRIAATLEERYTARFAELNALKELLLTEDVVAAAATATVARARSSTVEDRLLKSGEERAARQKARLAEVERKDRALHHPTINRRTKEMAREGRMNGGAPPGRTSVEDSLIGRGKKSKAKIKAMRAKRISDEVCVCACMCAFQRRRCRRALRSRLYQARVGRRSPASSRAASPPLFIR